MKVLMPIILAGSIPILWLAMRISDTQLALPVIGGITVLGSLYCGLARGAEAPRSGEISSADIRDAIPGKTAPHSRNP